MTLPGSQWARRSASSRTRSRNHSQTPRSVARVRTHSVHPVRLGILGCGRAADELHLPALQQAPQLDVVAAADPVSGRLHHLADRYVIQGRYTDDAELLANPAVEAVAVLVPPWRQLECILTALEAGKHVFVGRPGLLFPEDLERVRAAMEASGRLVQVRFTLRWHPSVRGALEVLRAGRLGSVHDVRSWVAVTRPASDREAVESALEADEPLAGPVGTGNAALYEAALQQFDLWRYLLCAEVEEIGVAAPRADSGEEAESVAVSARLAGGIRASTRLTVADRAAAFVDVRSERGRIQLECGDEGGLRLRDGAVRGVNLPTWAAPGVRGLLGALARIKDGGALRNRRNRDPLARATRDEWSAFGQSILWWQPSPCDLQEASRAVAVLQAGLQSLRTEGKPCAVAPAVLSDSPEPVSDDTPAEEPASPV